MMILNVTLFVHAGKCEGSWSMYIDGERSWLMHQADHFNRTAGGVVSGDVVGLYLNLSAGTLTFYVNGLMQVSCLISFYYYTPFCGTT